MISGAVSAFLVRQRIHELMRQFTDFGENRTFFPREGGPRIPRWTFLEDDVRCAAWFNSGYTLMRQSMEVVLSHVPRV